MTDFSTITACGECCTACPKKLDGRCPGCIEADGRVPEWAESGRCKVHACTREHGVRFCGLCAEFPCDKLPSLIFWNPDITERMASLRDEYRTCLSERKKDMSYMFETEHLKVRKFGTEDAETLCRIHLDEEVKKWIPGESYENPEEARETAEYFADCVAQKELPYVLAVELKETGELIGDTGINEVEGKPEEVEIGFVIRRESRGKGYATELVRAMTVYAVETFHVNVLYGRVMKGNNASVRVLEKNGYRFVTEETGAEDDPYGNGMLVYQKEIQLPSSGT